MIWISITTTDPGHNMKKWQNTTQENITHKRAQRSALYQQVTIMLQREGSPYLACNDRNAFFTSEKPKKYHAWSCQNVCDALTFLLDNILFDLAPSSIDK